MKTRSRTTKTAARRDVPNKGARPSSDRSRTTEKRAAAEHRTCDSRLDEDVQIELTDAEIVAAAQVAFLDDRALQKAYPALKGGIPKELRVRGHRIALVKWPRVMALIRTDADAVGPWESEMIRAYRGAMRYQRIEWLERGILAWRSQ